MPGFNMKETEWSKNLWERCKKVFKLHDARISALEQGGGGGVYDALAWKSSASLEAIGQTSISMSGITFREMLVVVWINNTDNKEVFYLPKEVLGGWYRLGGESGSLTEALVTIYATENGVTLTNAGIGGTDYTSTTKVKAYYR